MSELSERLRIKCEWCNPCGDYRRNEREAADELDRLEAIKADAKAVVHYWEEWPDCCPSLTLHAFIARLAKALLAEKAGKE